MKSNSYMKSVTFTAAALLVAGLAVAGQSRGIQHEEWSFDWPEEGLYFSCLNDTLNGTIDVIIRSHSFETPSGVSHIVEGFFAVGQVFSKTTGRTWTARGSIPGSFKLGKGETALRVDIENYIPDSPGGQHFFIRMTYKLTVNANGELVVERSVPADALVFPDDYSRCVGKK